ncbi:hypothetical protein K461DRAFT_125919 [Myriangium duriaei CBS 260.36]|uniref:Uncharacterized protein n=1 Tax=Myriangium duriaei CBS 260.36 TaxID=1168546 RepID=A0A9P4J478_9PEZI|nr:hypothetical protein K461DRAFT_125919 [Myriangium duriaei CBS 260.36]
MMVGCLHVLLQDDTRAASCGDLAGPLAEMQSTCVRGPAGQLKIHIYCTRRHYALQISQLYRIDVSTIDQLNNALASLASWIQHLTIQATSPAPMLRVTTTVTPSRIVTARTTMMPTTSSQHKPLLPRSNLSRYSPGSFKNGPALFQTPTTGSLPGEVP